jgi:hypothetical protein
MFCNSPKNLKMYGKSDYSLSQKMCRTFLYIFGPEGVSLGFTFCELRRDVHRNPRQCPLASRDCNQNTDSSTNLNATRKYQISWKYAQWWLRVSSRHTYVCNVATCFDLLWLNKFYIIHKKGIHKMPLFFRNEISVLQNRIFRVS